MEFSLTPLGAGDLIDRSVRFYRKNFWTFVAIAAPPIFVGTLVSIFWGYLGRSLFNVGTSRDEAEISLYYLFLGLGNLLIWLIESIAVLSVMGGASRNFVRHILFGEPITFRETYKNTKTRLGGLIVASAIIIILLVFAGYFILGFGMFIGFILVGLAALIFSFSPILTIIVSVILSLAVAFFTLWLFFLLVSRFMYVPQVMLVEGQGVFAAIGRSMSLASGNVEDLPRCLFLRLSQHIRHSRFFIFRSAGMDGQTGSRSLLLTRMLFPSGMKSPVRYFRRLA